MKAHKIVPGLLMAGGLALPIAATVEFLSHVGVTKLASAQGRSTQSKGSGKGSSTPGTRNATPTPTPTPAVSNPTSGSFTGAVAQGPFGPVQAQLTVKAGKITNVSITAPKDNPTSQYINSVVVPMLRKETLQAQSANINVISGATVTSEYYYQSLVTALKDAGL